MSDLSQDPFPGRLKLVKSGAEHRVLMAWGQDHVYTTMAVLKNIDPSP